jgi:hypothetical protein
MAAPHEGALNGSTNCEEEMGDRTILGWATGSIEKLEFWLGF